MNMNPYSILLVSNGQAVTSGQGEGYCAQHALEQAIRNATLHVPFGFDGYAIVKDESRMNGPLFKIELVQE